MAKSLTAGEARALLIQAGVDHSELTITDDSDVWTNIDTGVSGTSVRIDGPEEARRGAEAALFVKGLAVAPYPDHDYWSRS